MKRLNANAKTVETLREVFLLATQVGSIVTTMAADCRGKASLIRDLVPRAIFKVGATGDEEETEAALMLLVDRWVYF